MGVKDMLGGSGIFICDNCRGKLKIEIPQEIFDELKAQVNETEVSAKRCYLCSSVQPTDMGLNVPAELMANALEKNLEKAEEMWKDFEDGKLICPKCATRVVFNGRIATCQKCNSEINTKKFGKSIKLPMIKRLTFKQYIKFLRGNTNVPGQNQIQ